MLTGVHLMRSFLLSLAFCAAVAPALGASPFHLASSNVLVVDDVTGQLLLEKDADIGVPMASLTKLLTAMVVLDAQQDLAETVLVTDADLDRLKHTQRGIAIGTRLRREHMLELALQTSDNRAASALARNYPGGIDAFLLACADKARVLGLQHTVIVEPTGLSPHNRSSAADMALVLKAASAYPLIESATRSASRQMLLQGRLRTVHNTNQLVGREGWDILLSKTGFTNEAGRCLAMRIQEAGRVVRVVLLGGFDRDARNLDALNIRRWLRGEAALSALPQTVLASAARAQHHNQTRRSQAGTRSVLGR
jgi:D-alanyl-D-alanine carboxypeptidase/D-alanyl-D-alanine endopeptidase (penicillin-binding protein 7)